MANKKLYRITFLGHNRIYELYVRGIAQSDLFGFVEISDFVFGENSQLVVDPSEEQLKLEFLQVKSTLVPMQAIIRIDEVKKEGVAKMTTLGNKETSNISRFPNHVYPGSGEIKP